MPHNVPYLSYAYAHPERGFGHPRRWVYHLDLKSRSPIGAKYNNWDMADIAETKKHTIFGKDDIR
jgi:hypothetical protein